MSYLQLIVHSKFLIALIAQTNYFKFKFNSGRNHNNFQVLAGQTNLNDGELIEVTKVIEHPEYDDWAAVNDVVILKLSKNIIFGNTKQPIPLPVPGFRVASGRPCNISGKYFVCATNKQNF